MAVRTAHVNISRRAIHLEFCFSESFPESTETFRAQFTVMSLISEPCNLPPNMHPLGKLPNLHFSISKLRTAGEPHRNKSFQLSSFSLFGLLISRSILPCSIFPKTFLISEKPLSVLGVRNVQSAGHFFLHTNRIFLPSSLRLDSRIPKCSERAVFILATG